VKAIVGVRTVESPLKIDLTTSMIVNGGLVIEEITEPVRANIRGLLF